MDILGLLTTSFSFGALALLVIQLWERRRGRYALDTNRVGDLLAARLLRDYRDELDRVNEEGLRHWAQDRYMAMAVSLGLPSAAVDDVTEVVVQRVRAAQGHKSAGAFGGFYE